MANYQAQNSDVHESEADEALSLCDLPLQWEEKSTEQEPRRLPPAEDVLFEFSSNLSCDMCAADEIFLRGKFAPNNCGPTVHVGKHRQQWTRMSFPHLRSESVDETKSRMTSLRCSYSAADHRRLRRVSSVDTPVTVADGKRFVREFSVRRVSGGGGTARAKWWYLLAFGLLKPPMEMEIKDIRNRQRRRGPSTLLPTAASLDGEAAKGGAAGREEANKGQWRLLRALSCKGNEAIAVG